MATFRLARVKPGQPVQGFGIDMKDTRKRKNPSQAQAGSHGQPNGLSSRLRAEWPLLVYPALFAATLVILHVVNRSIEKEASPSAERRQVAPERTVTAGRPAGPATTPPTHDNGTSGLVSDAPQDVTEPGEARYEASYPTERREAAAASAVDHNAPAASSARQAAGDLPPEGPARVMALLEMAVGANDHAQIKACLDELVALGDAAVVPLNDLVNAQSEAGLWAAEALARIGTPLATTALLDTLAQTKEGLYKEELGKRVASISNHDSWPILLDTALQTGDASVVRAAETSLSMMADTPVIDGIIARYEAAATEAEIERLTRMVRNIQSPKATDSLVSLAGPVSSAPEDALQRAAIDALAKTGDPQSVSYLLRRLEATTPGQGTDVFNAITQINRPEAQTALLYAAAGNKEVSAEYGRIAAIQALKNYPDARTITLLEQIIAETHNDSVLAAAARTLDDIRLAPHAVTAKADGQVKEERFLPESPMKK